jgi:amino acid adenylation domain-containing protein
MTELRDDVAAAPVPAASATDSLRDAVGGVWCAVLGVDQVGPGDDFFLSGGDSAQAVETAISLRALTGTELDLDVLYQYSEFGKLLAFLTEPQPGREQRPLTAAEENLWFAERLHPGSAQYNIAALYRFAGRLDVLRLRTALDALVGRHDALRRGFETPGRVVTAPHASVSCRWLDLRGLPESTLRQVIDEHARRPFDLASPPLLRALVIDRGDEGDLLLLTVHHLVCDGGSLAVLEDELSRLYANDANGTEGSDGTDSTYRAYRADVSGRLPTPAPRTNGSGAVPSRLFDPEQSRAYWRRTLADCPRGISLPHDLPRPAALDIAGGVHLLVCAEDMAADMAALAKSERLSPFMTWVLAYAAGLLALTGERDMVIGIAASSRTAEQRGEIGMFVDPVPLRLTIPPGSTARSLASQVRRATIEALAHRGVPFQQIVEDLGPGGDPARAALMQAALSYLDASGCVLRLDGLEARRELLPTGTSKYELLWQITRQADRTVTELEYLSDLFSAQQAADVHAGLLSAASAAFASPDAPLLAAGSLHSPSRTAGNGAAEPDAEAAARVPLPQLVRQHAARQPDAPALRHRDLELTYRQLDERALAVAAGLRAAGLRRGDVVAVPMTRSADAVTAYLGIGYAGCAYLPLDPELPIDRLHTALRGVADAAIVAEPLASLPPQLPVFRIADLLTDAATATDADTGSERVADSFTPVPITGEDAAYLMSTSGSTGTPKTVVVPHRAISRLVPNAEGLAIRADDTVAHVCNPAFDAATLEIWGALGAGAVLVVGDKQDVMSPARLRAFLGEHRISVLGLPTALLHTMIDVAPDAFGDIRLLVFGGEKADERRMERLLTHRPPGSVVNVYGPTENTTVSTLQQVTLSALDPGPLPIGRCISGSTAYALAPDGRPVVPGAEGELYVGGDGLAIGYHGDSRLTAATFVPNPFSRRPGERIYRTGDRVRPHADGSFLFVGRNDDQVKVRGFRVELGEIEHALLALPGVTDAAVVVRNTPDGAELVACVTGTASPALEAELDVPCPAELDTADLANRLRTRLPDYMIPALVVTDRLPLNANGKVDRAALLASLPADIGRPAAGSATTATDASDASDATDAADPDLDDPLAEAVATLLCESLGLERVGPDDSFVALGGHSIKALKLLARVDEKLGAVVELADFLAEPTLRGLLTAVRADLAVSR